jgi:Cytochrome c oxidase subunit III
MAATKQHDYHLVDPSPWPFVGSMAAFLMAIGAVTWMHGVSWGPLAFGVGLIGVLYTMLMWWMDVVRESAKGDHTPVVMMHHRYGMILFIASEVMFFVAWFWAYFEVALFPAQGHRDLRSLAPAAPEHADPAPFRHHGDLGAPCSHRGRQGGREERPVVHRYPRPAVHRLPGL